MSTSAAIARAEPAVATGRWPGLWTPLSIVVADVVALTLVACITILARLHLGGAYSLADYGRLWPVLLVFLLAFTAMGLYPGVALSPVEELRRVFHAVTVAYLILAMAMFLFHLAEIYSRAIFLVSWPWSVVAVLLARSTVRHLLASRSWWGLPAIVFGDGGGTVIETLSLHPWFGIKVVGRRQLESVHYAIVGISGDGRAQLEELLDSSAANFCHVLVIPDLLGRSSLGVTAKDIAGMLCLEMHQNLLKRLPQVIKRGLDFAGAVTALAIALPAFVVIGAAIRLTSRGPAFYGHRRVGQNQRPFTAWKFRTMVTNGDAVLRRYFRDHPEAQAEWQRNQKLRVDPRITRVGRWLRRSSLDELPQLWNVLLGDMSLVGPRPVVQAEVEKYGRLFGLYCKVRPGLTGLWQVSGRNRTTYRERVALDEYYVRNWSIWLDLYILARTAGAVLLADGAY